MHEAKDWYFGDAYQQVDTAIDCVCQQSVAISSACGFAGSPHRPA
jgi:hypothetical protein